VLTNFLHSKVEVEVRQSRSKMQRASTAGMGMIGGGGMGMIGGGGMGITGASYSTRRSVADSGVSSPTEAVTGGGYSERYSMTGQTMRSNRTSTSSNHSIDFRRSMTLEGLKNEVMDV